MLGLETLRSWRGQGDHSGWLSNGGLGCSLQIRLPESHKEGWLKHHHHHHQLLTLKISDRCRGKGRGEEGGNTWEQGNF